MNRFFSDRHGYRGPEPEITIREDAPDFLRFQIANISRNCGMSPSAIRMIVCDILLEVPDPRNWSEYPNIWEEVLGLLRNCEWYKVYDIAEALWRSFEYRPDEQGRFEEDLNRVFREKGIGWQLKNPDGIVFRGDPTFAIATEHAVDAFAQTGRYTAAGEIREALKDISRRPDPDRTGAIQHSMAALECVARDLTNSPNLNLGQIINGLALTPPLGDAVHKLWGTPRKMVVTYRRAVMRVPLRRSSLSVLRVAWPYFCSGEIEPRSKSLSCRTNEACGIDAVAGAER